MAQTTATGATAAAVMAELAALDDPKARTINARQGLSLKRCFRPDALDVGLAGKVP
ncbi:hypothetical protein [Cryobacterium aureum]|uniref:hypothetical protein n=1 Tax=Cryobacterium aureum TaxID=995037 RepID=UPI00196B4B68|nr:hypothetical protein [Cryobacterium aureum]